MDTPVPVQLGARSQNALPLSCRCLSWLWDSFSASERPSYIVACRKFFSVSERPSYVKRRSFGVAAVVVFVVCCWGCLGSQLLEAGEPSFPWGQPNTPAPYLRLAPRPSHHHHEPAAAAPVQTLPDKPPYAYGWFGPESHPQWGRHFGFYRNFTQWTRR